MIFEYAVINIIYIGAFRTESKPVAHPCRVNRWIIIWYIKTRVLIIFDPTRFSVAGWTHSRSRNTRHCGLLSDCRRPYGLYYCCKLYVQWQSGRCLHTRCADVDFDRARKTTTRSRDPFRNRRWSWRTETRRGINAISVRCDGLTLRCAENCTRNLEFGKHARGPLQNNMSMSGNQRVIRGFATSRTE